jgi:hypothetical protein
MRDHAWIVAAAGLALAIGWGIRGNFGHETGAMVPGALAALTAVLLSGREDWLRRAASFAFFGALGWSFGGSISYMQVIGYTHSAHSLSVAYGFACLFIIGFCWGAFGGAGTALPAVLDDSDLRRLYPLVLAIFGAWMLQDLAVARLHQVDSQFRHEDPLYWKDTDWLGVLVGLLATLVYAAARRRFDYGCAMVAHMCVGWWAGFLILVELLGWRMTPPRGDNWAGCLGMAFGLVIFFARRGQPQLIFSTVLAGTFGGLGFAGCQLLKLAGVRTSWETNWHSVLEQTYGLVNGLGIGVLMFMLARRVPSLGLDPQQQRSRWTERFAAWFVVIGITWLNLRKNPGRWLEAKAMPESIYGLPTETWFHIAYALLALLAAAVLWRDARGPLPLLNLNASGRAGWLMMILLWWMVAGNFERAVVSFAPQRIITEGVIFLNAVLLTAIVLLAPARPAVAPAQLLPFNLRRIAISSLLALVLITAIGWTGKRLLFGDAFAGHAAKHVRFGPDATATKAKPQPGKTHP